MDHKNMENEQTLPSDKSKNEKNASINHFQSYSLSIGENLWNRIDKHINLLKHLDNKSISKQNWVKEALEERLALSEKADFDKIPKAKHMNFKINESLNFKIEQEVKVIKKLRKSYSKKKWIVDALYDKLDREDHKARSLIEKIKREAIDISQIKN